MARTAIGFAAALIILGVAMFAWTGAKTSLIPAYFGAVLGICGFVSMNPAYRKHGMHAAAAVATIGCLMAAGRLIMSLVRGGTPSTTAVVSLLLMALLCGAFVVICARSFIQARRNPTS